MSHRSNRRVAFTTLGCKVNQADTDEWIRGFQQIGYDVVDFDDAADAYVVNTCTVTHVADRKSRQLLRQARRTNPGGLVIATGCYASVAPHELSRMAEVDLVISGADKPRLVGLVHAALEGDDERPYEALAGDPSLSTSRTRAFVKISDGCNKFCAFCIVPYARGRETSRPFRQVIDRVDRLARSGYREIVLTAVHMGTYGRDLGDGTTLRRLITTILDETPVERLRLSSIEPEDFDDGLLDLWPDSRLCRHFHLALDSGCATTLRRMRRRYDPETFAALVDRIRARIPDVAITTDVMVGFPGESEAEFAESYAFVERMGFAGIHVFPYSPRHRTAAAKMPNQVPPDVKRERTAAMIELASTSAANFRRALIGQRLPVLFEDVAVVDELPTLAPRQSGALGVSPTSLPHPGQDGGAVTLNGSADPARGGAGPIWQGLTDNYVRVYARCAGDLTNTCVETRLADLHPNGVWGEVAGPVPEAGQSNTGHHRPRRISLPVVQAIESARAASRHPAQGAPRADATPPRAG